MRRGASRCLPVMSISPTRLIDGLNMVQSQGNFKTALLP
jgi:hypothetical protein